MKIQTPTHNFIMYFIRMLSNLLFMVFIFSYISRILGPVGIGKIQYYEVINKYFLLFINLGIFSYGQREIAIKRENIEETSKLVTELLLILLITTALGIVLYVAYIKFYINTFEEKRIMYIYMLNIILNLFNVEWFYLGIENQSYITKRDLLLKVFSSILILKFVKREEDIYTYLIVLILGTAGASIFNFFNLFKYIKLQKTKFKNLKKHLKYIFILFSSTLALSISYNLDSIMLKNISGTKELGYYIFVNKIGRIPVAFTASIVAVTQTRMANFIGNNNEKKYKRLRKFMINIIILVSLPTSSLIFLLSEKIVYFIGGSKFTVTTDILKVFSLYILIISFSYITGSLLMANKEDRIYSFSLIIGGILNFLFNIVFIIKLGALGAVIATIITESIAVIIRIKKCKKIFLDLKILNFNFFKIILANIFMLCILVILMKIFKNIPFFVFLILGEIVYFIILLYMKEKFVILIKKMFKLFYLGKLLDKIQE